MPGGVSTVTGRVSVRRSNLPVRATAPPSDWPLHAAMETQAEGWMGGSNANRGVRCGGVLVFPGCLCPHGTSNADVYKTLKTEGPKKQLE